MPRGVTDPNVDHEPLFEKYGFHSRCLVLIWSGLRTGQITLKQIGGANAVSVAPTLVLGRGSSTAQRTRNIHEPLMQILMNPIIECFGETFILCFSTPWNMYVTAMAVTFEYFSCRQIQAFALLRILP